MSNFGLIKVAAAVPPLLVADIDYNVSQILAFARSADAEGAKIVVFPELSITGYTAGDLFHQRTLLDKIGPAIAEIKSKSKALGCIIVVGAPLEHEGKLFNSAFLIHKGKLFGIVPKTHMPNYKEFYEQRWFASGIELNSKEVKYLGKNIPVGTDLLFRIKDIPQAVLGIEICEDLWVPIPPSSYQALSGATIIANLSASNELVAKADYRKTLISQQSSRTVTAYIYAGSGVHESTTDLVFGGHAIIAENGSLLSESKRFERKGELILNEIDLEHLLADRARTTTFGQSNKENIKPFRMIEVPLLIGEAKSISRKLDLYPFVPQNASELDKRSEEIFQIQTAGLAKRLEYARINKIVLGLSGGLDSTLAVLVAAKTFRLLNIPQKNITALTMPGLGTTHRTKNNAIKLAEALNITLETIDISKGVLNHLKELKHDGKEDVTYQNAQARYRTMILMDKANQIGALVLGTGDLSEIALGWSTFNGDHISHYNVNASIPKTLVKYLVEWINKQPEFSGSGKILKDILATPISPELVKGKKGVISQKTEDLIGPYELHDFFLYHMIRWGSSPKKILFFAENAFGPKYSKSEIKKWLTLFIKRFFANQWKRSVMADGPKVGSVALSPRGDWRMPSDAEVSIWLKDLE